jgi:phosphoribosylaminoimidazolecarboxamide formyltransferase/IMP cyclohydrolase
MELAMEAYGHTPEYDACISRYLAGQLGQGRFPGRLQLVFDKVQDLRYGENPHQQAAFTASRASPALGSRARNSWRSSAT